MNSQVTSKKVAANQSGMDDTDKWLMPSIRFKVGNSVVLNNVIRKTEGIKKMIVVTSVTKVFMGTSIEVPDNHKCMGENMLNPPPAEKVTITEALGSPMKKKMSVEGKIVQEDEPRTVSVRGEDVTLKQITIQDDTGKTKVTLWRQAAQSSTRPGDMVRITDVVLNSYQNTLSLSRTMKTKLEKCEVALREMIVVVEGVCVEDEETELLLDSMDTIKVPTDLLKTALELEDVEGATSFGSITLKIKKGTEFPQKPGAEWMLIPQTPYVVDMSRYFTDITVELDKWLTKVPGSEMDWNQTPDESLSALDQRFASVHITGRPTTGSDWLMLNQDGLAYNPMANYMKNVGGLGNCGDCKGKQDCAAINLF